MKNAIILHGIDETRDDLMAMPTSPSNSHHFPTTQWQLIKAGILTQTPEMPDPYLPDMNYDQWVKVFKQFDVNENTILIGHSAGGGFLLKYLSLHPNIKIDHLVLIAPWLDIEIEHPTFFTGFNLDTSLINCCNKIDLFCSSDDMDIIIKSVDKIKSVFGDKIKYHEFADKGHFCVGDIGKEFPELLDVILNNKL